MNDMAKVRAGIAGGQLSAYGEFVAGAANRLLDDPRMMPHWTSGFSASSFWRAMHLYECAVLDRNAWSKKTQRERDEWNRKFNKAVTQLQELMKEAPTTPEEWGFPARDNVLLNVAYRMGMPIPEGDDNALYTEMLRLEAAADAECWTIADSLRHYQMKIDSDCTVSQVLKKPGDEMAGRAEFIVQFRTYSMCSTTTVATVAQVVFEDEAIDERLVRRLTATR
jgi:hypothetical protein